MGVLVYDEALSLQQKKVAETADMIAQRRDVLTHMKLQNGEHILEVGSGNGIFAKEMYALIGQEGRICGIDFAEPMVLMAQAYCPEGEFEQASATQIPHPNDSFDVVTASQVLCFVEDIEKAVSEMFRVLKPNGRLIILDTDWDSLVWNCKDQALMKRVISAFTNDYANPHLPRTLSRLLIQAGFGELKRDSHPILNWDQNPNNYSQQLITSITPNESIATTQEMSDWKVWLTDQQETADTGDYMFSVNRYIFTAIKP